MEQATAHLVQMATTSKHFVRRLLTIGVSRLELLMVEGEEKRERRRLAFRPPEKKPVKALRSPGRSAN